jgi:hypothetical protein
MGILGFRVPTRNLRDFPMLPQNCPSARCTNSRYSVCSASDVLGRQITTPRFGIILRVLRVSVMSFVSILLCDSYGSCLLSFVICVVLFLLLAIWLLTRHVSQQDLNRILSTFITHSGQVRYWSLSSESTNFQIIWFVHGLSTFWPFMFRTVFKTFVHVSEYRVIWGDNNELLDQNMRCYMAINESTPAWYTLLSLFIRSQCLYMFRALLAHLQEALHRCYLV